MGIMGSFREWWSLPQSKITLLVVVAVLVVALMSKWAGTEGGPTYSKRFLKQLNRIVQQSMKWHSSAMQDSDPLVRLIHANYALAYAQAARSFTGADLSLERLSGVRVPDLMYALEDDQKKALQTVVNTCPQIRPTGMYTTGSAWM